VLATGNLVRVNLSTDTAPAQLGIIIHECAGLAYTALGVGHHPDDYRVWRLLISGCLARVPQKYITHVST